MLCTFATESPLLHLVGVRFGFCHCCFASIRDRAQDYARPGERCCARGGTVSKALRRCKRAEYDT